MNGWSFRVDVSAGVSPDDGSSWMHIVHRLPTKPPWNVRWMARGVTGVEKVRWMNWGRPCGVVN